MQSLGLTYPSGPRTALAPKRQTRQPSSSVLCHASGHDLGRTSGHAGHASATPCQRKQLQRLIKTSRKQLEATATTAPAAAPLANEFVLLESFRDRLERLVAGSHIFMDDASSSSDDDTAETSGCLVVERRRSSSMASTRAAPVQQGHAPVRPPPATSSPPLAEPQQQQQPIDVQPRSYEASGRVLVCTGKKCMAKGAGDVFSTVSRLAADSPGVAVLPCKCLGKCSAGAAMRVKVDGVQRCSVHTKVTALEAVAILDDAFTTVPAVAEPAPVVVAAVATAAEAAAAPMPASVVERVLAGAAHVHSATGSCCIECGEA